MNLKTKTPTGQGGRGTAAKRFHGINLDAQNQTNSPALIDLIYAVSDRLDVLYSRYKKAGAK